MNTYEKYKPSGIEWIGDIPEHWEAKKLKFIGQSMIGIIYSPDDVSADEEGLLVLRSSNIQNGVLDFKDCVYVNKTVDSKYLTKSGDILICARNGSADLVGKCALIDENAANLTFGAFMSIVRSDYRKLLYYFFSSEIFKSQKGLFSTSTINQLTSSTLNNLFIAVPPDKAEQTAIADYLDEKTAKIDKLIANKERLIELLKEERTAIINKAVTRGINADAKLKPSGIDWLGDIPEHWEVKQLRYAGNVNYGITLQLENGKTDGMRILTVRNVDIDGSFNLEEEFFIDSHLVSNENILKKGDLLFNWRNGSIKHVGKTAYFNLEGIFTHVSFLLRIRTFESVDSFFLKSFLNALRMRGFFSTAKDQVNRTFNSSELGRLPVVVPPIEEQKEIVKFIESKTNEIDSTISKIEKEIELIKEYRTALISEVVTGKIRIS